MKHPMPYRTARAPRHITGKHGKPLEHFYETMNVMSGQGWSRRRARLAEAIYRIQQPRGKTTPPRTPKHVIERRERWAKALGLRQALRSLVWRLGVFYFSPGQLKVTRDFASMGILSYRDNYARPLFGGERRQYTEWVRRWPFRPCGAWKDYRFVCIGLYCTEGS